MPGPQLRQKGPQRIPPCPQCAPWEDLGRSAEMGCALTFCMAWVDVFLGGEDLLWEADFKSPEERVPGPAKSEEEIA